MFRTRIRNALVAAIWVLAIATLPVAGKVKEEEHSTGSLRGAVHNTNTTSRYDQERQALAICNVVQDMFGDTATCTCTNRWLYGDFGFSCETKEAACRKFDSGKEDDGVYCAKTRLRGQLLYYFFQLKTTLKWDACQTGVMANNTVAGNVMVGDVCIGFGVTGRIVGNSGISSCSGQFGGIQCDSCTPCTKVITPLKKNSTTYPGISLKCNSLEVTPCFPSFGLPIFVPGRDDGSSLDPLKTLASFDPFLATQGPAMELARQKVEQVISEMDSGS